MPARLPCPPLRREALPPRRAASPIGAILLSTSTMLVAIAASTLLLRDRTVGPRSTTLTGTARAPAVFVAAPPLEPRSWTSPPTPCYAPHPGGELPAAPQRSSR